LIYLTIRTHDLKVIILFNLSYHVGLKGLLRYTSLNVSVNNLEYYLDAFSLIKYKNNSIITITFIA